MSDVRPDVPERVRAACAAVAREARSVRLAGGQIAGYAESLCAAGPPPGDPATQLIAGERSREDRAAFVVCMDAINFGSGWWPTIRKRQGRSGYATIATGLTERFRVKGPWSADDLSAITAGEIAGVVGQDPGHPLMELYAESLRDAGEHVRDEHRGSFAELADGARGSAPVLVGRLAGWRAFADTSEYRGVEVPFFKRAQLAAADLHAAGVTRLSGRDRLTAFADNLVPHVLRLDGVLLLDPLLSQAIDAGELLEHGSTEEVELRACAVHAVELLSDAAGRRMTPAEIDAVLWNRGQGERYKATPRPRCRTTAY